MLSYGLPIVALTLLFSAAGIPTGVPIHVVLMATGAYLIGSLPGLAVAIVALAAAELAGTLALHLIARTGGVRLLERMASDRQERMQTTFDRWRGRLGGRDVAAITVLRLSRSCAWGRRSAPGCWEFGCAISSSVRGSPR